MTNTYGNPQHFEEEQPTRSAAETLASLEEPEDLSLLQELTEEAGRKLDGTVRYPVDTRPGWFVEFSTNITLNEFKRWQKAATKGKGNNKNVEIDLISQLPLVEKNTSILKRKGADIVAIHGKDGKPLTFRHEEFTELFGGVDLVAATKFLGDGPTVSIAQDLLDEAGYGTGVEAIDPSDA